jgi:NADPH-dependent glutamate synthase beta subunit-like oxidoreductase
MSESSVIPTRVAPCRAACPADVDVPRYVGRIRAGDFDGALATIREKIPFAAVCGHACFHPCEAACARRQYDQPVDVRRLKRVAAERGTIVPARPKRPASGRRVAVIGAGPGGLTAAWLLALAGHRVEVFEAAAEAGGLLRHGIPGHRLPAEVVDREIAAIAAAGVRITTGVAVADAGALLAAGHDAVLVATGAARPLRLDLDGGSGVEVIDGLALLRRIADGERVAVGARMVVVGGGNTAIDAARAGLRLGAATTLVYRRGRDEMPASAEEIAEAEEEGLAFVFGVAPKGIAAGRISLRRLAAVDAAAGRRSALVEVAGSDVELSCDTVVIATGQRADAGAVRLAAGPDGRAVVDATSATPSPGIFAAGDLVAGPSTIIDAIAAGRKAASAIDRFLGGDGDLDLAPAGPRDEPTGETVVGRRRQAAVKRPAAERVGDFAPVEIGWDDATAIREAERCLACHTRVHRVEVAADLCKDCGYCAEICTMGVFGRAETFNALGHRPATVVAAERCVGCLKCFAICPDFAVEVHDLA